MYACRPVCSQDAWSVQDVNFSESLKVTLTVYVSVYTEFHTVKGKSSEAVRICFDEISVENNRE
jgi:hypothetical protein